jgi:hypothetical protein
MSSSFSFRAVSCNLVDGKTLPALSLCIELILFSVFLCVLCGEKFCEIKALEKVKILLRGWKDEVSVSTSY